MIGSTNSNFTRYLVFAATAGEQSLLVDNVTTPLSYNPNTGTISAKVFEATQGSNTVKIDAPSGSIFNSDSANTNTVVPYGFEFSSGGGPYFFTSVSQPIFFVTPAFKISDGDYDQIYGPSTWGYTFPAANGTSGQAMFTNGSGQLYWGDSVKTNVAQTFTELQTFSAGICGSGGATFAASIGSNSSTVDLLNSVVSTINFGGVSGSTINLGNTSGNSTIDLNTNVIRDLELRSYFESKAVGVYTGAMIQTWTLDLSQAQVFTITTSGNISTIAVNNTPSKSNTSVGFTTVITQGGGHTISWASWSPGTLKWAGGVGPSLTATAGKTDIFSFVTYDGGTNWYGFVGGQNF